jgi:hypothetical protein
MKHSVSSGSNNFRTIKPVKKLVLLDLSDEEESLCAKHNLPVLAQNKEVGLCDKCIQGKEYQAILKSSETKVEATLKQLDFAAKELAKEKEVLEKQMQK